MDFKKGLLVSGGSLLVPSDGEGKEGLKKRPFLGRPFILASSPARGREMEGRDESEISFPPIP